MKLPRGERRRWILAKRYVFLYDIFNVINSVFTELGHTCTYYITIIIIITCPSDAKDQTQCLLISHPLFAIR